MLADLQKEVVAQVKRKVIPHEAAVSIELMAVDDGVRTETARSQFPGAVEFAMAGRMDRACEMLRQMEETEKTSVSLYCNLGVCEESAGAFWKASEYFQIADRLTTAPDKLLNAAIARNESSLKKTSEMSKTRSDLICTDKIEAGAASQTINRPGSTNAGQVASSQSMPKPPQDITSDMLMLEKRTALVIGNGAYSKNTLANPVNDARAMAKELRKANFQVIAVENADHERMIGAIDEFGRAIKQGGVPSPSLTTLKLHYQAPFEIFPASTIQSTDKV